MFKNLVKRPFALILVVVMIFSFNITSFAVDKDKITIFDDEFDSNFKVTKASSAKYIINEQEPDSGNGTYSFSVQNQNTWDGYVVDITGEQTINLWKKNATLNFKAKAADPGSEGKTLRFDVQNETGGRIYKVITDTVTNEWKTYSIELEKFLMLSSNPTPIEDVLKTVNTLKVYVASGCKFYIDDLYIEKDPDGTYVDESTIPDVSVFEESADGLTLGDLTSTDLTIASNGSTSLKIDFSTQSWWNDVGAKITFPSSFQLTRKMAEHGYLKFKYKATATTTQNVVFRMQRAYDELTGTRTWGNVGGDLPALWLGTTNGWVEKIIPLKDFIGATELEAINFDTQDYRFYAFTIVQKGFAGTIHLDEIGIYFPKITGNIFVNDLYYETVQPGEIRVEPKIRGVYDEKINVYVAVYEGDMLKDARLTSLDTVSGVVTINPYTFTASSTNTKIKVFAWTEDMVPIANFWNMEKAS